MKLKDFILQHNLNYKFKIVKFKEIDEKILNLIKDYSKKVKEDKKFINKLKKVNKDKLDNFLFILRCLDFRLWEFPKNWEYKNEFGFFGLMERVIDLFKGDYENINFNEFKKIISPKENNINLVKLRYKVFKNSLKWLHKKYDGNFKNYFEEFRKPMDFCLNLCELEKFKDYYKNLYFLKPNQLLYLEYILGKNLVKEYKNNLEELTIFSDWEIMSLFLNLKLIEMPLRYLKKIKRGEIIKKNSLLEIELRNASIILGEEIAKKINLPSYILDNILWSLSRKMIFKIPKIKVKTIFY